MRVKSLSRGNEALQANKHSSILEFNMSKEEAIKHFGGASSLARALGVSPQAVHQWKDLPELRQYQLRDLLNAQKQG